MAASIVCLAEEAKKMEAGKGYGYDNLILRVEWAAPREERA